MQASPRKSRTFTCQRFLKVIGRLTQQVLSRREELLGFDCSRSRSPLIAVTSFPRDERLVLSMSGHSRVFPGLSGFTGNTRVHSCLYRVCARLYTRVSLEHIKLRTSGLYPDREKVALFCVRTPSAQLKLTNT